jgi:hypothetical protein
MKTGADLIMNPGHFQMARPRLRVVILLAYTHFEQPQGARPSSSLLEIESGKQIMKRRMTAATSSEHHVVRSSNTSGHCSAAGLWQVNCDCRDDWQVRKLLGLQPEHSAHTTRVDQGAVLTRPSTK